MDRQEPHPPGAPAARRPRVSAVLVSWNSLEYLPDCLESLATQTRRPDEVIVVDNGSVDGTREWLAENAPDARLMENAANLGFCVANNQGIRASSGEYVLLVNTDVILEPRFINTIVESLEADPGVGSASGKLLKLTPGALEGDGEPVIDSTGEVVYRTRRALNRGDREIDRGQYEKREEVFGVTAAAAIYRREMLEDVRIGDDYLDSDYFAYLEDCDLNWRARLRGWRCLYVPAAVGRHVRHHPRGRNVAIRRHAYFNRYYNLLKNETWVNLLLAAPHLLTFEVYQTLKTLVREPDVLAGFPAVFRKLPAMFRKRRTIQSRRRVSSRYIRSWMVPENYFRHLLKRCCRGGVRGLEATPHSERKRSSGRSRSSSSDRRQTPVLPSR